MDLKGKKILVTGADGFIGSHLTEFLVREGCDVRAFVYYNSFNSWGWLDDSDEEIKRSIEVIAGDIRDQQRVRQAMKSIDVVFHLAALIAIPYSYYAPESYVDTNIKGTLNIVQAANDLGTQKVVHTSTSEVYGTAIYVPIDEGHPLQGQSPYSASKIGADSIAMSFHTSFGLPLAIARPFNTFGPRQSARAIIPTIITQILSGQSQLKLGALHPTRDLNYVKDTIKGLISVAQCDETTGQVVNIGSNREISIGDLVKLIASTMGREVDIIQDDTRMRPKNSEVERLWADNTRILNLTGWKPVYSLQDGLKETIEWFANIDNLTKYKSNIYNV
ncbi:MAG: NAD-dependent 4,6-dehydratase LegB [Candidatus Saccharibacteria bacterium]